jgi:hypothetical protein
MQAVSLQIVTVVCCGTGRRGAKGARGAQGRGAVGGQQAPAVTDILVPAAGGILGPAVDVIHEAQDDKQVWIMRMYVIGWRLRTNSSPLVHSCFLLMSSYSGSR